MQNRLFFFLIAFYTHFSCMGQTNVTYKQGDTLAISPLTIVDYTPRDTVKNDTVKMEESIYTKIMALPEMISYSRRLDSVFFHEVGVSITFLKKPSKSENFFWVQMGYMKEKKETREMRFIPEYNFYVYPENLEIKVYDPVNNTVIDLDTWRRRKQK